MNNVISLPPRSITVNRKAAQVLISVVGSKGQYTLLMGKVELAEIRREGRHWARAGRYRCVYPRLGDVITATVRQLELDWLTQRESAA